MNCRYLLNFSYIGTHFRGSQKSNINIADSSSVQGSIEIGLRTIKSTFNPETVLSSRTDTGVHAFDATAHVDLFTYKNRIFDCINITSKLNKYFCKNNISIIIKNTQRVPHTFHARFSAVSRTYLYRLAVAKTNIADNGYRPIILPIEEWRRCFFIINPSFEIEKLKEAAPLFEGIHDFETFRKADKSETWSSNVRTILSIKVSKGSSLVIKNDVNAVNLENIEFWDVSIKGRAFIHNQIRRIIGALKGVAIGKLNTSELLSMLQVPSRHSWPSRLDIAPPHGLYLCNVEYKPKDLIVPDCGEDISETILNKLPKSL